MSKNGFGSLSKADCKVEYAKVLANSDQCWTSGERLAEAGDYGRAMSLAIISIEELTKASLIYLDSQGFRFRKIRGVQKIFKDHRIRYFIAFSMFVASLFGDDIVKFISSLHKKTEDKLKQFKKEFSKEKIVEQWAEKYAMDKFIQIARELEWFAKVDVLRQNGFYCDYDEQLISPVQIDLESYREVVSKLEKVRKVGLAFIASCSSNDPHVNEQLDNLLNDFKNKDYYQRIEHYFEKVKNKNLFDLLGDRMKDGIDNFIS